MKTEDPAKDTTVDPATGQPSPREPATGAVVPGHPDTVDPNTGVPYLVDPRTGATYADERDPHKHIFEKQKNDQK
jgi:hypothetical protein